MLESMTSLPIHRKKCLYAPVYRDNSTLIKITMWQNVKNTQIWANTCSITSRKNISETKPKLWNRIKKHSRTSPKMKSKEMN